MEVCQFAGGEARGNQFSYASTDCHPERLKETADFRRESEELCNESLLNRRAGRRIFDALRLLRTTQRGLRRIFQNVLIGFIQTDCKSVIPRSGATWESPGTASVIATFYQEIAAP